MDLYQYERQDHVSPRNEHPLCVIGKTEKPVDNSVHVINNNLTISMKTVNQHST